MTKKKSKIGCLFWVALVLLVVVIFLFNRERIKGVLESTGFTSFITKRKEKDESETPVVIQEKTPEDEQEQPPDEPTVIEIEPTETQADETTLESESMENINPEQAESSEDMKYRNAKLYFIDVDNNGVISLQAVVRSIPFEDSPLTETLRALLVGMLPSELNMELINLIPENTELLSVRVNDGTAYINFNEAFRFNSLGKEGYIAQLKQVLYTATEFSTVNSVQFLIEGDVYDYLGPEGVFIGQPLTRSSFN